MAGQGPLAISVERHPSEFARTLQRDRLRYTVFRSRQRWVFFMDFLPRAAAEATSRFLHRVVLPEMLREHIESRYATVDASDRRLVWEQSLPLVEQPPLARGTAALLLPELVEHGRLSITGWLRFRGERFFRALVAELARTGFQHLWLERALRQFQNVLLAQRLQRPEELVVEGQKDQLQVRSVEGRPLYREFIEGHLDPNLEINREDLVVGLLRALNPRRVHVRGVSADLVAKLEEAGVPVDRRSDPVESAPQRTPAHQPGDQRLDRPTTPPASRGREQDP